MKKIIPLAAMLSLAFSGLALAQGGVSHRETMKVPDQAPGASTNQQGQSSSATPAPSDPATASGSSTAPSNDTSAAPPSPPASSRDPEQEPGSMTRRPGRGGR
jgi:hypothetical protein